MEHRIRVVFKSGREISVGLLSHESFETFWDKAIESEYVIAGDLMFRVDEVEYSEVE